MCAASFVTLTACAKAPAKPVEKTEPTPAEDHRDEPAHEELPTRVRLTPEVVAAARVRTAPVQQEVLAATLALPGEIVSDPDRTARVASPIAGRIEQLSLAEGEAVDKGETLLVIRVPELGKLRSARVAALAKAKAARASAVRLKGLLEQRLTSEQSYLDAVAEAEAQEAEARAIAAQLAALGMSAQGATSSSLAVPAPISGTVVNRKAVIGQPLSVQEVIADIIDMSEVWFLGRVFEKDLGRLRAGARSEVQLNAYPSERFQGVVEYIGQQVDPTARTVTARIRLINRDGLLRIGLFGTAYVSMQGEGSLTPTLVVPRSALTEIAGKPVVFVRHADEDFELHELVLGRSAAGKVQVIAGLREGEQVVVEGAFTLKSAVLKSTFAEED